MYIEKLKLKNIKSFDDCELDLSQSINLFVGKNNSGKTTLIQSLYLLQQPTERSHIGEFEDKYNHYSRILKEFSRISSNKSEILIQLTDIDEDVFQHEFFKEQPRRDPVFKFVFENGNGYLEMQEKGVSTQWDQHSAVNNLTHLTEPLNLFYPFFSRRKHANLDENVSLQKANLVLPNFQNIYSKIARISQPDYPSNKEFRDICIEVFGFPISVSLTNNGLKASFIVNKHTSISVDTMGEGTLSLLGLIVDLCISENKIFLIEELENDVHPQALKKVIDLIIKKSSTNQFVISTHSNIILKYLGSLDNSKTYHINMSIQEGNKPTSVVNPVFKPDDRVALLTDLGYDIFDFDLFKSYLILEEASAETIIRDFLIPNFYPGLQFKLKTISAKGTGNIEPAFNDFLRLFVFVHTSEIYKHKAWVVADGDPSGVNVIESLKKSFSSWNSNHFVNLEKSDFEYYYPTEFLEKAEKVLSIQDKRKRKEAKKDLLLEVISWIQETDINVAKEKFKVSAAEILSLLDTINSAINSL